MIINISHYVHFLNAKIIDSSSCFNIGCYPAAIIKKNVEGLIVYAGPTIEYNIHRFPVLPGTVVGGW
jgi:glutamine amidotransferase-like uncharacterized protein